MEMEGVVMVVSMEVTRLPEEDLADMEVHLHQVQLIREQVVRQTIIGTQEAHHLTGE